MNKQSVKKWAQRVYYGLNPRAVAPPSYFLQFIRTTSPAGRPCPRVGQDVGILTHSDGSRDFSQYDEDNFLTGQPRYENYDYFNNRVRKEDMGCAAMYAFGVTSFPKAQMLFPETSFADQMTACLRIGKRTPRYVADLGCGLGSLAALFVACGVKTDAVDPSPIARAKVLDTVRRFTGQAPESFGDRLRFQNIALGPYMDQLRRAPQFPDTFVMIESIEHMPKPEVMAAVKLMRERGNCMLIVTNAVDLHPLYPDGTGWNHICLVDDAYYDELAQMARRRVLRAGSHLVLQF